MLKKIMTGLPIGGTSAFAIYVLFFRPWHLRYGATAEQCLASKEEDETVTAL